MIEKHRFFWREHPAFLFAITLVIGMGAALFWSHPWNWLFPLLWSLYLLSLKKGPLLLVLAASAAYCHSFSASSPKPGLVEGIFSISTLQPHQSPFSKGFVYKGTLYTSAGSAACSLYSHGQNRPFLADRDYFMSGKLESMDSYEYVFKPKTWTPIEGSWSLAEWRYLAKEKYRDWLSKKCPQRPRAAQFLASLTAGDVDDRLLKYEFGRLGLQHLLAISGFHFGILIAFITAALTLILPRFWALLSLLLCLTAYYFFIGPFPAVQRSWLTAIVYLAGKLLNRQTSGLNLLGFAMGFEIVLNPFIISHLGFQFSFASCAGILLLHPLLEEKLRSILPKRSTENLPLLAKHAYLLSSFFRHALAINLSVNVAILPILLFHFHSFPLLSLLYNLFFPFSVGIALCGLLLALAIHLFTPSFALPLFSLTSWYTDKLLQIAAYPPSILDYPILVSHFPEWVIPFALFALLVVSVQYKCKRAY